jgi:2-amino-4-hydroxy-6-hydroxymethyldihydropteridine diphosphokinase
MKAYFFRDFKIWEPESTESMNKAYLLIGGNQGDRFAVMSLARTRIEKNCGMIVNLSSLYETAPWGKTDQPYFINQALILETSLDAPSLMASLISIELQAGRKRIEKYGPRTLDIDILLFNEEIWDEPDLKIPHPELAKRRFALAPLNEIAPDLVHPILQQSMRQLYINCQDYLDVKKI